MKIIQLQQGTPEWVAHRREHFNASDAPAMLGVSKYKTRTQLLHEMATGITPEVDAATQRRFDDGHRFEALARPLAEEIAGVELSPITGAKDRLSASFDGIDFDKTVCLEHKTINNDIRKCLGENGNTGALHEQYRIQMEQQLAVSGAKKCLFMATKWDDDELIEELHGWYLPDFVLRGRIAAGWTQFAIDLEEYKPREIEVKAVAEVIKDLPSVSIQVSGNISLITNLDLFGKELSQFVESLNMQPTDDQGFADADAAVKSLKKAEEALESSEANALAQTASIDAMRRTVAQYKEIARTTRLALEKMVKARKEQIKVDAVREAGLKFSAHIEALEAETRPIQLSVVRPDFGIVIKGLRTLSSIHDALDTALRDGMFAADKIAADVRAKLTWCKEYAAGHSALFPDLQQIISKPMDDFALLINSRIEKAKADEAARMEAERAKMQAEATAKAEREAARMEAERAKMQAEATAKAEREAAATIEAETARIRAEEQAKAEQVQREKPPVSKSGPAITSVQDQVADRQSIPPITGQPTRQQLIGTIADDYSVELEVAEKWLTDAFAI